MGALGHYFESEGIPTTQISLVREHTEAIRPPRALSVPFDLGRPLGAPDAPDFQRHVLQAALRLLERPSGPVLEDFPEEAPDTGAEMEGWACPIPLRPARSEADPDAGDTGRERAEADAARDEAQPHAGDVAGRFAAELARLRPWYDLAVDRRKRTTVGLSGLSPDELADFLPRFLNDPPPESPIPDVPRALALKRAADDLRALYTEAATAQPGARSPTPGELNDWFWNQTAAGALCRALREKLRQSDDRSLQLTANLMLVPATELTR